MLRPGRPAAVGTGVGWESPQAGVPASKPRETTFSTGSASVPCTLPSAPVSHWPQSSHPPARWQLVLSPGVKLRRHWKFSPGSTAGAGIRTQACRPQIPALPLPQAPPSPPPGPPSWLTPQSSLSSEVTCPQRPSLSDRSLPGVLPALYSWENEVAGGHGTRSRPHSY